MSEPKISALDSILSVFSAPTSSTESETADAIAQLLATGRSWQITLGGSYTQGVMLGVAINNFDMDERPLAGWDWDDESVSVRGDVLDGELAARAITQAGL